MTIGTRERIGSAHMWDITGFSVAIGPRVVALWPAITGLIDARRAANTAAITRKRTPRFDLQCGSRFSAV